MNTIKISYDQQSFHAKPSGDEIRWINSRIAGSVKKLDRDGLQSVITRIGSEGCTFSPATFKNGKRSKDNFEQQQLFALDFDNKDPKKKLAFEEEKERASQYELPILFAYDTMSSTNHDKFRVVYLNDVSYPSRTGELLRLCSLQLVGCSRRLIRHVIRMYPGCILVVRKFSTMMKNYQRSI